MAWFDVGKTIFMNPRFNWGTAMPEPPFEIDLDVIFCALMADTYAPNLATNLDFADIVAQEIVCTGYVGRGDASPLGTKVITQEATLAKFDALDLIYSNIGGATDDTFDQIAIGRENDTTPTDASSPLIATVVVPTTTTNGGNVTLIWDSTGILHITA